MLELIKGSRHKPSKRERAARVLPISNLTLSILEARLFLDFGIPPVPPGGLRKAPAAGLLRDAVIRPLLRHTAFLGVNQENHRVVVRNAPWLEDLVDAPMVPSDTVPLFARPAGWIVGCLLFRYLLVLMDESTYAHRSYRDAALNQSVVVDVDAGFSTIQVYLPLSMALAMGHAVASHFILGKSVP